MGGLPSTRSELSAGWAACSLLLSFYLGSVTFWKLFSGAGLIANFIPVSCRGNWVAFWLWVCFVVAVVSFVVAAVIAYFFPDTMY